MKTNRTYAIYWIPGGYTVSANYESLIDGFFQNVAAASGRSDNVYSLTAQYGDSMGPIVYSSTFGGSVVDTDSFPASGCTDGSLPVCLTDGQLQAEIDKIVSEQGWPAGLSSEFFLFTPTSVGSCIDSSSSLCAYSYYCAYHSSFTSSRGNGTLIYANEPYAAEPSAPRACDKGQRPNGDAADPAVNLVSHEQAESITDPFGTAWFDAAGDEIGDKCAWMFGQPLGSTGGSGTDYNEQIGSGRYYLQEEWSNSTYDSATGTPGSCLQRDKPQLVLTGPGSGSVSGGGVTCSSISCDLSAEIGEAITLTAAPASGSSFVGWQGDCTGDGTCAVTVDPTSSVVARFESSALPAGWAEEPVAPPAAAVPYLATDPSWNFFRIAEAANGEERAISVGNGDGSCGVGSAKGSGGIFLERQTSTGWLDDGALSAPVVGDDEWRYWPSCGEFGAEIDLSADGETLLASEDMTWAGSYRCAAFIYQRETGGWTQAATLFPPGIGPSGSPTSSGCDYFGINSTLSADGQRAVVLRAGAVDVFVRGSSGWTLEQDIVQPSGSNCGYTVGPPRIAISGDGSRLLVGAPDCAVAGANFAGQVYDYERSGSTWTLTQTIDTPEPTYNNYFGTVVALSRDGNTAAIGTQDSTGLPSFAGAVWVYEHDSSGWQERERLTTPAPEANALLSCPYVSPDGDQIICTAFDSVGFDPAQGSLYAFERPGLSWTSAPTPQRFFANDGHSLDNLGTVHYGLTWFMPSSIATADVGGDITTTIAAQNIGLYANDRIGYEFTTGPVVDSFAPTTALAGTSVTITGANFSGATAVTFDGTPVTSFTVDSPTQITATVPSAAANGPIGVTTVKGSGWTTGSFGPLPAVGSFAPTSGAAGTVVAIAGSNLTNATAVDFAGVPAQFASVSATEISATVPATASSGPITVTTPVGTSTASSGSFSPLPAVSDFSPDSGPAGTQVQITGTNLAAATSVLFANNAAASFTVLSATEISATVPATASAGPITVTTPAGSSAPSSGSFSPLPVISSFSPVRGSAGTPVVITGTNLASATSVLFGRAAAASFTVLAPTEISATVPATARAGALRVATPAGSASSTTRFDPLPSISSLAPHRALAGKQVVITGSNLAGATTVKFGNERARFDVASPTQILARVPARARIGRITVLTATGIVFTSARFEPLPAITSISARHSHVGSQITIRGTNLADATSVTIGGRRSHFRVKSPTKIIARLPAGVTGNRVTVSTPAGKASRRYRARLRR